MGGRAHLRRAEDASGSPPGYQAGAVAERDAGGSDPGGLCRIVGPFRDPIADVRGGRDGRPGPGRLVVHRMFPDPEVSAARMPGQDARGTPDVVRGLALGDAGGADGAAAEPGQSTGDQAKDVEMEEETSRTSSASALGENLSGDGSYDSLNGIALKPSAKAGWDA